MRPARTAEHRRDLRGEGGEARDEAGAPRPWLSVVIPARNEAPHLGAAIASARAAADVEVVVVDGDSDDQTPAIARSHGAEVLRCLPPGRADQMNLGAARARGETLVFLHADTRLPRGYAGCIQRVLARDGVVAGAFRLAFDDPRPALRLVARGANLRSRWWQLPYGDQALFLPRDLFQRLGGFPRLPVMEDYALVRRLRRLGRIQLADRPVITSARQSRSGGVWRTVARHQAMLLAYHLGVSPRRIARWHGRASEGELAGLADVQDAAALLSGSGLRSTSEPAS